VGSHCEECSGIDCFEPLESKCCGSGVWGLRGLLSSGGLDSGVLFEASFFRALRGKFADNFPPSIHTIFVIYKTFKLVRVNVRDDRTLSSMPEGQLNMH